MSTDQEKETAKKIADRLEAAAGTSLLRAFVWLGLVTIALWFIGIPAAFIYWMVAR